MDVGVGPGTLSLGLLHGHSNQLNRAFQGHIPWPCALASLLTVSTILCCSIVRDWVLEQMHLHMDIREDHELELQATDAVVAEEREALSAILGEQFIVLGSRQWMIELPLPVSGSNDETVTKLVLELPDGYPETEPPFAFLDNLPPSLCLDDMSFLSALPWTPGTPCIYDWVCEIQSVLEDRAKEVAVDTDDNTASASQEYDVESETPEAFDLESFLGQMQLNDRPQLGRRAFFSHHIIAPSKQAAQLRLGGMAKIGWPGLIIVEGDERHVRLYVDALSRLRWKHFVVRGEEIVDGKPGQSLDDLRVLPLKFEMFGTQGMSQFADRCRQFGLYDLFLACLKIGSAKGGGGPSERNSKTETGQSKHKGKGRR
eukprot:gnl/TRDRNA2_/TRDRNA2_168222_c0_seq2.p1 gnl/TRDRNA2_/TRDRNA2_168222_c0~~gnl/TRDRNA2_/TRDRNA2_168222_c0_seq2.p1  ORF type:complete len:371 (+),score=41.65 gnl/TRDRNA2_/TRDRNA2_168222_c0_seq2:143-1255(+)